MTAAGATEQRHYAVCALDCPSACALDVQVNNNRIVRVRGHRDHPFTQGIVCEKVANVAELVENGRIQTPLLRNGPKGSGRFREIGWDEAIETCATKLQGVVDTYGAEAVLAYHYAGTMGLIQQRAVERLVHRAGFSRLGRSICFAIAAAGWKAGVGAVFGPTADEVEESDLIVLWGINPVSTHIHFMRYVQQARRRGTRIIVVDPYRTRTAAMADVHMKLRPGSDAALACAVMHVLLDEGLVDRDYLQRFSDFDDDIERHLMSRSPAWAESICNLDAQSIRALALAYGEAKRPYIRLGVGMSRQRNGAVNVHAVSCLPTLVGAWPKRGAGALISLETPPRIDDEPVRMEHWALSSTRTLDMCELGRWLTDKTMQVPVQALLVFNANPAASCPDAAQVRHGLLREDLFTVVHESVMTDTAQLADIVLPATHFLEQNDLYRSYGHGTVQMADAVLTPPGQARCNNDVVNSIAKAMGYEDQVFKLSSEAILEQVLLASGLPCRDEFAVRHWIDLSPDEDTRHFRHGFPQLDGRFHFRPGWSDDFMPPLPDHWPVREGDDVAIAQSYPLEFMTPPSRHVLNTTFAYTESARERRLPAELWLHPDDAEARSIGDGDDVFVFNARARLSMTAKLTEAVSAGVCLCESNHPACDFPEGLPLNALLGADPVAPAGGAAFHDCRVEVQKA